MWTVGRLASRQPGFYTRAGLDTGVRIREVPTVEYFVNFSPVSLFPISKKEEKILKRNIFFSFLEKRKLDAFEMQKKTFAFWRAARGRGWSIFERFGVLSLWKGIGYVLRLFPFCSGLGAEFVPARDARSEAGRLGDPVPRGRRRLNQKFMWCLGWTSRPV